MRKVILLLCAVGLISPVSAFSVRNSGNLPFHWDRLGGGLQNPVEQQSPIPWDPITNVVNNTGCNWDVDDYTYIGGAGIVFPDETQTATRCLIADGTSYDGPYANNKTVTAEVSSTNDNLTVTMTNSEGKSWIANKTFYQSNHKWVYTICTVDLTGKPFTDWAATYPELPGTNGGRGLQVTYTLSFSVDRKSKVTAQLGIGTGGCPVT